ncbi:MAG: CoA-binding protein [Bacteroidetes bacterium]|nr:CoA-binding protein [Bacteroidota bacterium]
MKKTLVIGASTNKARYSNIAIHRLLANNHPVVAFGLREGTVGGVSIQTERLLFEDIDTVTLYIGPKHQPEYYEYIVSLNPKRVIFNPGTENPNFYQILTENNIVPEIACTLVLLATNQY